jgi:hypothetical protein
MTAPVFPQPGHIFLIGGLGAGKTELALNLAILHAETAGPQSVDLIDLDIVNPYFRVRKVLDELEKRGVNVIVPNARVRQGDLPALPAAVWGSLENTGRLVVCDVGGGEMGLRPLGRFREIAARISPRVFFLINPFRPGFRTPDELRESFHRLQTLSALQTTHLIANPHLMGETTPDIFVRGWEMVSDFAREVSLPVEFAMVAEESADVIRAKITGKLLVIRRFWRVPWILGLEKEG